jgi:hypothetical protein
MQVAQLLKQVGAILSIAIPVSLGHVLAAVIVAALLAIVMATRAVCAPIWKEFGVPLVLDLARPRIERLRRRLGAPSIDKSPAHRDRHQQGRDG